MSREETIRVGDLVMIVGACCSKLDTLGLIATVEDITHNDKCRHPACGTVTTGTIVSLSGKKSPLGRFVPIAWLKKISPPGIDESTERRDEATA